MTAKLLTEQHFEFLSLTGGSTDSSESNHIIYATAYEQNRVHGVVPPMVRVHWSAFECDFQQCGILTSVDSDEPLQPPPPPLSLETPNDFQSVAQHS